MRILVIGLGVIGTTYGYLFHQAGHTVEHLVLPTSRKSGIEEVTVHMLDGRDDPRGVESHGAYPVVQATKGQTYDLILVSLPDGALASAIQVLDEWEESGPLLLFCGTWNTHDELEKTVGSRDHILGYPVAGGSMDNSILRCCVMDEIELESPGKTHFPIYDKTKSLFKSCEIDCDHPYDMLQWIWLHMAINAAVVSVAAEHGDIGDTSGAAVGLMENTEYLQEAILAIRETALIVNSRGVDLRNFRNELLPYDIPTNISAPIMRRMFAANKLTHDIMTLHNNLKDLLYVCDQVYVCGRDNDVPAPIFYNAYACMLEKVVNDPNLLMRL